MSTLHWGGSATRPPTVQGPTGQRFRRVRTTVRPESTSTNLQNPNTSPVGGRFCWSIMAVSVGFSAPRPNRAVWVQTDFFRTIVCLKMGCLTSEKVGIDRKVSGTGRPCPTGHPKGRGLVNKVGKLKALPNLHFFLRPGRPPVAAVPGEGRTRAELPRRIAVQPSSPPGRAKRCRSHLRRSPASARFIPAARTPVWETPEDRSRRSAPGQATAPKGSVGGEQGKPMRIALTPGPPLPKARGAKTPHPRPLSQREKEEVRPPQKSHNSLQIMVLRLPRTGFEPVTYGLGNRCSIP